MTRSIGRRTLLGGAAGAIAMIGSGAAAVRPPTPAPRPADAAEAAYAKLLADVHDDYVNGRVVEHNGWVLSQHELDTIGSRQRGQKATAFPQ